MRVATRRSAVLDVVVLVALFGQVACVGSTARGDSRRPIRRLVLVDS
jgi:hypothetical protein